MKSESNIRQPRLLDLGNGNWYFNYNEVEKDVEGEIFYEYDTIKIEGEPTYNKIVNALIRKQYSVSDELAILRQRDEKVDEYQAYYDYCEECKQIAKDAQTI